MRRAREDWQKEQRSAAILMAAEQLFRDNRGALPRVDKVAQAANVAKGTVYLYYPSKEAMFLALFDWRVSEWIDDATALIEDRARTLRTGDVLDAQLHYPLANRVVLDLASYSSTLLEAHLDEKTALGFKAALEDRMMRLGRAIEASALAVEAKHAALLCLRGYAYMVGLWQIAEPPAVMKAVREAGGLKLFDLSFEQNARAGLEALWARACG